MRPNAALPARGAALLFALVTALLVLRLGEPPLVGPDEPRYARVAVEMHRRGEAVVPTLQGRPWLEKPPLYYWLGRAGGAACGPGGRHRAPALRVRARGGHGHAAGRGGDRGHGARRPARAGDRGADGHDGGRWGRRGGPLGQGPARRAAARPGHRRLPRPLTRSGPGLAAPRARDRAGGPGGDGADAFLLAWLLAPLAFFSIAASKLPGYILPCVAPLAMVAGRGADALVSGRRRPWTARAAGLVMVALGAVVAASPIVAREVRE